jgi:guanosine-3',5'-bis(diphosphate) 3'-pyrophosphohydrolase
MPRINEIIERVQANFAEADPALLERAYVYSAKVHQGQIRLSGEAYLSHPLAVADILADMRLDDVTVAAGLLHDTVEDTLATGDQIGEQFGEEIRSLVEALTKLSKIEFQSREEQQAENFRKMLLAMSKDIRVILIKLADRLHNMRTLQHMDEDARRRISQETLDIYAPLAHRLGIYWMKQELEERAFREVYPELSSDLEKHIKGTTKARARYIEVVISQLAGILERSEIRAEVTGRLKELYSLYKKMREQELTLDEVYDLIAFRVIVDGTSATCYETLGIVHSLWKPVSGRFKDYIAMPKPNGYRSLHTTVIGPFGERMEVQIRTQEMHRVAELGIASHWKYKQGQPSSESDEQQFAWLRQLLEWQQHLSDPNEFLETVRVDLFPDEVYVFTPQGDVRALPAGATPIDFAFAVHSEIGNHCAGAKVNGQLVPLRHRLSNGDTVEILTSPHQHPRREWLENVVTGRARTRIRHYLRLQEVQQAQALGRQLLERDLKRRRRHYDKLLKAGDLSKAARALSYRSLDEMLQAIAYGKLPTRRVIEKLGVEPEAPAPEPSLLERVFRPRADVSGVKVGGVDHVLVRFGRCCSPLPGDPVDGFITRGRGVTVHTRDCPRIFHLDPERRVPVSWDDSSELRRSVKVRVVSQDRPGLLAAVSKQISAEGVNIEGGRIFQSGENRAVQTFDLAVKDRKHLDNVIRKLTKLRGILSVERVRS